MRLFKKIKKYLRYLFRVALGESTIFRYVVEISTTIYGGLYYYIGLMLAIPINLVKILSRTIVNLGRYLHKMIISMIGQNALKKRTELHTYFREIIANFYSKKVPSSDQYPFAVHNPYRVFNEAKGYEKLFLVGDNWTESASSQPIALMIGFNNWKYGFIADYLPEYKVVFTKLKISKWAYWFLLQGLKPKPNVIIVWGYTDNSIITKYAKRHNIPLYRMEDGFVRSALLGASHATPYSLILDKQGLYYNPEETSDIEHILNTSNFTEDTTFMKEAQTALDLLVKMKLSKYNTPSLDTVSRLGIKTKKRVVILGQVDNDAAIRYGNLDHWTSEDIVRLARYENPDADVYYRPHPEVYKGYQKSKFRTKKIEYFAKIVPPDEPLLEFLESIDHVYVINSLSGLEALLRGIKVTVMGAAFYGGWGLTDDRYKFKNRKRQLSLLELFVAVYLKYPRYLANTEDSILGFKAGCYQIDADYKLEYFSLYKKSLEKEDISSSITNVYWPHFLMYHSERMSLAEEKSLLSSMHFKGHFEGNASELFQMTLLYFIVGKLKYNESRDYFIRKVRMYIESKVLNLFLLDLMKYYPGDYILQHFTWLFKENKEFLLANTFMETHFHAREKEQITQSNKLFLCQEEDENGLTLCKDEIDEKEKSPLEDLDITNLRASLDSFKVSLEYDSFISVVKKLLISNNANTILFTRLCEMATIKSDAYSAKLLAQFLQKIDIYAHNKASVHMELENFTFEVSEDAFEYTSKLYALQLTLNPDRLNRSWARLKGYYIDNKHHELFASIAGLYSKYDLHKTAALLEINNADSALRILEHLIEKGERSDKLSVEYSKTLFSVNRHEKAKFIIENAIKVEATHINYTEYLRQLKALGEFDKALYVAEEALAKKVPLTMEGHVMPIYFGLGRLEDGFTCFHDSALHEKLHHAFGIQKYRSRHDFKNIEKLFLIFSAGPAEEMRFSSMYDEIAKSIGYDNFTLTCDYRLKNILSRSFPKIHFLPVERTRFFTPEYPIENYNLLPNSELCTALDNTTLPYIEEAKEIKMVSDYFYHFRKNYSDFKDKKPHLKIDKKRMLYFKDKLPKDTYLVGLSWRSTLTNAMRNVHYLDVDDLAPLFSIPNVTFVNLQYDHCLHELDEIKDKYDVDVINFPELDQMNDFDGVAGLMKSLDVVIAPFTAVIELAGSIGVNGILFSNHGESHWRKIDKEGTDVWYESIKVIGSGKIGEKTSMVQEVKEEILTQLSNVRDNDK